MGKLSDKMELFCQEYLIDFNATQAAIRAKYSEKTANEQGSQNLAKLSIRERISELINEKLGTEKDTLRLRVITELSDIAFGNISIEKISDRDGNIIDIRLNDRIKALELLGKYGALWTEKIEHSGNININFDTQDSNL